MQPNNPLAMLGLLGDAWDQTKQPMVRRGMPGMEDATDQGLLGMLSLPNLVNAVAPVGQYEDGSTGPAWPALLAAPVEGVMNFGTRGYGEDAVPYNAMNAFDAAGGAMTGGLATGLAGGMVDNSVGIFGGRLAKTADQAALKRAESLAASGVPREQIWNDTGWFQGVDGKWRFEIDDSQASLGQGEKFGQAMSHPDLFAAYPDLAGADFKNYAGKGGYYSPYDNESQSIIALGRDQPDTVRLGIGLHEAQHGVQQVEDFASGGTLSTKGPNKALTGIQARRYSQAQMLRRDAANAGLDIETYVSRRRQWEADTNDPMPFTDYNDRPIDAKSIELALDDAVFKELDTRQRSSGSGYHIYNRLAGEVESRAVEKRQAFTPDERRARAPWLDYDVPKSEQFVMFDNSGRNMSVDNALGSAGGRLAQAAERQALGSADEVFYRGVGMADQPVNPQRGQWWASDSPKVASDYTKYSIGGHGDDTATPAIYPARFNFENPMELDAAGNSFFSVPFEGGNLTTDHIASIAKSRGNDGVIFRNLLDQADPGAGEGAATSTVAAALRPGTVYSATTGDLLYANAKPGAAVPLATQAAERKIARGVFDETRAKILARNLGYDSGRIRQRASEELGYLTDPKWPSELENRAFYQSLIDEIDSNPSAVADLRSSEAATRALDRSKRDAARSTSIVANKGEYTISRLDDPWVSKVEYQIKDGDGKVIGVAKPSSSDPIIEMVSIDPSHRGKGLATWLYDEIEKSSGQRLYPSGQFLSDEIVHLWAKRDFDALERSMPAGYSYFENFPQGLAANAPTGAAVPIGMEAQQETGGLTTEDLLRLLALQRQ